LKHAAGIRKKSHPAESGARSASRETGLRIVSLFEGAKGAIVLLTGFGLLLLIHKDLHQTAAELIRYFDFNPASKYPRIFLDLADRTSDANLWALASAALIYSVVRFAEAVGLWLDRRWAEWFGLLTGAMYLPLELFELSKGVTLPKIIVIVINAFVVLYLLYVLMRRRRGEKKHRIPRR
jgi:uncharacterized membrane protein (DUF2068 family)